MCIRDRVFIPEKVILWDWNGTLLDDAATCMDIMNAMLDSRSMPQLNLELYKEVFGFPVIEYYKKVGFDLTSDSFEELSIEFIDGYNRALGQASLAQHAMKVLDYFSVEGKEQIIISAMKQDMLLKSVEAKGISGYFTAILGIDDIYAATKSKIAIDYVKEKKIGTGRYGIYRRYHT